MVLRNWQPMRTNCAVVNVIVDQCNIDKLYSKQSDTHCYFDLRITLRLIIGCTGTSVPSNVLNETILNFKMNFNFGLSHSYQHPAGPSMRIATRDNKHTRDRRSAQFPVFAVTLLLRSSSLIQMSYMRT